MNSRKRKKLNSITHLRILFILILFHGSIPNSDLRELLDISETNLSNKTKELEERNLVTKDNKRPLTLFLTNLGKQKLAKLFREFITYMTKAKEKDKKCSNCKSNNDVYQCIKCTLDELLES